jgi:hypothetical protein
MIWGTSPQEFQCEASVFGAWSLGKWWFYFDEFPHPKENP